MRARSRKFVRVTLIVAGFCIGVAILVNHFTLRKEHLSASYWSLLNGDYCAMNGVGSILEKLYELEQKLPYLRLACPEGVGLSFVDLSPRLSLRNFMRRDAKLGLLFLKGWGADIRYSDFRNARFNAANLDMIIAFESNFTGTDFTYATLNDAIFSKSILDSAKLVAVKAYGTYFNSTSMVGADLTSGVFINSNFKNADMVGAVLTFGNFTDADFSAADLREANFTHSKLEGVNFDAADLMGAVFTRSEGLTCEQLKAAKNPSDKIIAEICKS